MDDERWPLLPPMLAALGLAAGVVVHLILANGFSASLPAWQVAALTLVTVAPVLFGFVVERGSVAQSAAFAGVGGMVAALIVYWHGPTSTWGASEGWRTVSLALGIAIAAPLFQGARTQAFRGLPYARVHDHAWTNVVLWFAACVFTGIVFLLAWLLAALFQLIGIHFLERALEKAWVWRPLVGVAFGVGLAQLREHERIVALLQNVVMLVLGVLAPVLAVGLGLFLLALPFTGLQPLWDATKATTPILLTCAVGALVLANAVIGNGADAARRNVVLRWAAAVLGVAMLPLVAIAAVATGLRIDQYGFTPERLWGLTFVVIGSAYALAYLVSVARGRDGWAAFVRPANLKLAVATCVLALVLATPLSSFNAISTRDQVARLESGRVTPEKFDWVALAYDFGEPGRAAVKRLAKWGDAKVRRMAMRTLKSNNRYQLEYDRLKVVRHDQLARSLRILPAKVELPHGLIEAFSDVPTDPKQVVLLYQPNSTIAVLVKQLCDRCALTREVVRQSSDGRWKKDFDYAPPKPAQPDTLARGPVEIRTVTRRQLFVGGQPVEDVFE